MVYCGGEVNIELALPISPGCVSVSIRWASLVSSGGRPWGGWVGSASVSSVAHDPFQNRKSLCSKVDVWLAVSLSVVVRVLWRLLVRRSIWSMWRNSFHSRAVLGLFGS